MKAFINILIFVFIIFFINLIFFFLSEDYRFFLEKIKNRDEVVYLDEIVVSDNPIIEENLESVNIIDPLDDFIKDSFEKEDESKKELVLGQNFKKILNIFGDYDLSLLELEGSLFDVTSEYPDSYFEYYSKELTLYLFPTKTYSEIKDIFDVLSIDSPFSLNEINNFGDKSFYINLNDSISDNNIRMVVSNEGVTFGLKIKKTEYNKVKSLLENNL